MELRQSLTRANSGLFERSIQGVSGWIEDEWDRRVESPSLVSVVTDTYNGENTVSMVTGNKLGSALSLPYVVFVPISFEENTEGFNNFALRKLGIRVAKGTRYERREKLQPINLGFGVKFVSNDIREVSMFSRIWQENRPDAQFIVEVGNGFNFPIKLQPDPQLSMPQKNDDSKQELDINTTLIVKTFVGTTEINKLITKVRYATYDRDTHGVNEDNLISERDFDGFKTIHSDFIRQKIGR